MWLTAKGVRGYLLVTTSTHPLIKSPHRARAHTQTPPHTHTQVGAHPEGVGGVGGGRIPRGVEEVIKVKQRLRIPGVVCLLERADNVAHILLTTDRRKRKSGERVCACVCVCAGARVSDLCRGPHAPHRSSRPSHTQTNITTPNARKREDRRASQTHGDPRTGTRRRRRRSAPFRHGPQCQTPRPPVRQDKGEGTHVDQAGSSLQRRWGRGSPTLTRCPPQHPTTKLNSPHDPHTDVH